MILLVNLLASWLIPFLKCIAFTISALLDKSFDAKIRYAQRFIFGVGIPVHDFQCKVFFDGMDRASEIAPHFRLRLLSTTSVHALTWMPDLTRTYGSDLPPPTDSTFFKSLASHRVRRITPIGGTRKRQGHV